MVVSSTSSQAKSNDIKRVLCLVNVARWVSAKEGILAVDMQLVRMSTDGVLPIAKQGVHSPSSQSLVSTPYLI